MRAISITCLLLLSATSSQAAIENLDELDARKSRRAINTYYSGESAGNGWNRQSETVMYNDSHTGNEVWILSNTPNKSNIFYTDLSPANPWSADGKRLGFFSNRPVSEFTRTSGSDLDGTGNKASTFTVNSDGSHLRAAYDSAERTWGSTGSNYFYWNTSVPDVHYSTGGRGNGLSLDYGAIYKNIVSDTGTTYSKLVDLPGTDTTQYGMKKVISPDGSLLLPKASGVYYPVRVYPEGSAGLLDADGWSEDRGASNEWSGGIPLGGRHDIYFPSNDFFITLHSDDTPNAKGNPVIYKQNITGTDADGGPNFVPSETTYSSFGNFEVEPIWTWATHSDNPAQTMVPWKIQYPTAVFSHGWGHPGFDRWGRCVATGDGNAFWATNGTAPLYEYGGPIVWDYVNRVLVADPTETVDPIVHFEGKTSYQDWNAWSDYFAGSRTLNTAENTAEPTASTPLSFIVSIEYDKIHDAGNDIRYAAYHYGNQNGSDSYSYSSNNRIAQSPDGTKIAYNVTFLSPAANTGELAYATAYYPHAPEIISVSGSGTYTIRFDWRTDQTTSRGYTQRGWPDEATDDPPPPRETKLFRLWRSANGTGGWTPAGTVDANIFTKYNFATGVWSGNKYWEITDTPGAGTWYYAVTAMEHSGLESHTLSNVFSTTGSQSASYPADPKADSNFITTHQSTLIRHYNIYAADGAAPSISQTDRIASIPVASGTSYLDWLGKTDGTTQYKVTAVDTQGNESTELTVSAAHQATPGQYALSWSVGGGGSRFRIKAISSE